MSQIPFHLGRAATLALLTAFTCAADLGADGPRLVIRIYGGEVDDAGARLGAIRTAAAIVEDAGIIADWRDCTPDAVRRPCTRPRAVRDLIVRIVPTDIAGTAALRGTLETRRNVDDSGLVLGFATIEAGIGRGVVATIFMDRVQTVAHRAHVDSSLLLGRILAHEVGHLLLGTNGHGRTGLMREVWTDAELASNRHDDWVFTRPERRRLRAGLSPEGYAPANPLSFALSGTR